MYRYILVPCFLAPAIEENTARLELETMELVCGIRERIDIQFLDQINRAINQEKSIVSVWQSQKLFYMIVLGPWSFGVNLK